MLDIKWVLTNLDAVKAGLSKRGQSIDLSGLEKLNQQRKTLQHEFDTLRASQNKASADIQKLQKEKQDASSLIAEMQGISKRIKEINPELAAIEKEVEDFLMRVPNLPHSSVPLGASSEENAIVRTWGEKPTFSFTPKAHWEIGENLKILDFERATKISGARFTLYWKQAAQLERALINFMLDLHTSEHGYSEVLPPFLVNDKSLEGTGQLPKFEEDLFKTTAGYYLIPTAEVPVTNIHRDEILKEEELPLSYTAYTPCFRSEAGSYGKDVRGLTRQHQFNKVELVKFVTPESSYNELEKLTSHAEKILQK
ncbi:MAG: serine--tRNA ligase, partial [Deltaproteobacteria bacterium]|nr:serine--tRNA ligase [Deltaproteobacteria bacterium]